MCDSAGLFIFQKSLSSVWNEVCVGGCFRWWETVAPDGGSVECHAKVISCTARLECSFESFIFVAENTYTIPTSVLLNQDLAAYNDLFFMVCGSACPHQHHHLFVHGDTTTFYEDFMMVDGVCYENEEIAMNHVVNKRHNGVLDLECITRTCVCPMIKLVVVFCVV